MRNNRYLLIHLAVFAINILCFSACYKEPRYDLKPREERHFNTRDHRESFDQFPDKRILPPVHEQAKSLPWETWSPGRDLGGLPINDTNVFKGDEYVKEGLRIKALAEYRKVNLNKISSDSRAAVVYRIAAMQLASEKPQQALTTLGSFFEKSGAKVEDVNPLFSLLFAYAFGRIGDVDQSFAWFSRVNRLAGGSGGVSDAAEEGARTLARSIPDSKYTAAVTTWNSDTFIHTILGQESRRRSSGGIQVADGQLERPFWESPEVSVGTPADLSNEKTTVAVLLPLSGRYSKLGQATKNGIELAFDGFDQSSDMQIMYKDTAGDRIQAAAIVQELSFYSKPPIILGPLLAETSETVANLARQKNITTLTLTKKSDFIAGQNVFRLGPTTMSQIDTLLEAAYNDKGVRDFGFVYSDTQQSREYIEAARKVLADFGLAPVYEVAYADNNYAAFSQIADEISSKNVQAIIFPDDIEAVTRFRFQMPDSLRRSLLLLGTAKWDMPEELRRSRQAMEGVMFVSPFFVYSDNPFVKQFQKTYSAKFESDADFLAAQGFDAATILLAAIRKQKQTGANISDSMSDIDLYKGLTGEMTVQTSGEVKRRFAVVELKKQGLQKVSKIQSAVQGSTRGQYEFR